MTSELVGEMCEVRLRVLILATRSVADRTEGQRRGELNSNVHAQSPLLTFDYSQADFPGRCMQEKLVCVLSSYLHVVLPDRALVEHRSSGADGERQGQLEESM